MASARELRLKAIDEEPVTERDGVFLYKRGEALSIEDVAAPISLFISESERPLVPEWLIGVISDVPQNAGEPVTLAMGNHSLTASWRDDELDITLAYDGETNQRFTLPAARRGAWLTVLQTEVARRSVEDSP